MNAAGSETSGPAATAVPDEGSWSGWHWMFYVVLAFAVHLGLIFVFGNRRPVLPRAIVNAPAIQLSIGRSELQTLDDPTLFALPHPHGFGTAAWLELPLIEFAPFRWTEPPQLMALPVGQLGAAFLRYAQTNVVPQLKLETVPPPELMRLPAPNEPTALKQSSAVRVGGSLENRRWLNPPAILRSWPATDLLTNSVVQVLADPDGQILAATLLPPGSGSKAADQRALELARSARFAPVARNSGHLTVGDLIFEWHTVPMPDTNAPPAQP